MNRFVHLEFVVSRLHAVHDQLLCAAELCHMEANYE